MSEDGGEDPALIGRAIAGKYVVEKFLGGGAMGAVYRAHQTALEKAVAIKVLHRAVATDASFAARFHREAKAASRLDHANSMRVIDFGEEPDGLLYIAMEYLEGRDLYKVIHEDWPLSNEHIVDILSQALAAIAVAHDMGVIHRDLKPENIMVLRGKDDEGNDTNVVKVCDFGIAKIQEKDDAPRPQGKRATTEGLVVGTPEYMSPEQACGDKLDARSDIYSMGVILYQLLTGRTPFTADTALGIVLKHITEQPEAPHAVYAGVNAGLEAVCLKAMAKNKDERYQGAREMRVALRSLIVDGGRVTPVDVRAPTVAGAPTVGLAATSSAPTIGAPVSTRTASTPNAMEVAGPPPATKPAIARYVLVGLAALVGTGAAAGVVMSKSRAQDRRVREAREERRAQLALSAMKSTPAPPAITTPPTAAATTVAVNAPNEPSEKDLRAAKIGLRPARRHANVEPAPAPPPVEETKPAEPAPPPPPPPSPPPPTTAQPPAPPPPAPVFNSATCRAEQRGITPHGVNAKDLVGLSHAVGAWTACARRGFHERPSPMNATVSIRFDDSSRYRGATCSGCGPIAGCVQSTTQGAVSMENKSGDVTGEPSFDVAVTFTCD